MITLDHVSKQYKSSARPALDNVSVHIDKGEFVFLIGPSGSGKSTFMRLLLAEESPTTGDVRVSKFHVNKLPGRHVPSLRQVLGCVFQDFRLLQQKSVFENVAFALEVIGKRRDVINRVVPDVLEMVGLSGKANRLPGELSGGEQQRVAIARAFVNRPLVLLADEPTGNLDPETSKDIMDLLERINRTGTTVLMATHDHHIVDSMRQRVVELSLFVTSSAASTEWIASALRLPAQRGLDRPSSQHHHDRGDDSDHRDIDRPFRRRSAGGAARRQLPRHLPGPG
jgi:cell division transport system ATP-binding protein